MRRSRRKSWVYLTPAERLASRFASLEKHRQLAARDLHLIGKLVTKYPELERHLRASRPIPIRLVVDNAQVRRQTRIVRYRCSGPDDGPAAA
jgi:hypothetical protein